MERHKRKRDDEQTVVTFYAPDRSFARVYKGQSLEETKALVRKKLGLSDDASLRLSRLHEGKVIELDDEEDFEAFRHIARHVPSLDVSVFVGQSGPPIFTPQMSNNIPVSHGSSKKRKNKSNAAQSASATTSQPAVSSRSVPNAERIPFTLDVNGVPKNKRKRKGTPSILDNGSPVPPPAPVPAPNVAEALPREAETGLFDSSAREKKLGKEGKAKSLPQISTPAPSVPSSVLLSRGQTPSSTEVSVTLYQSSKRKRQDTPEVSSSSSSRPPAPPAPPPPGERRPPSPSSASPVKKRRRNAVAAKDTSLGQGINPEPTLRSDKKGKGKAVDMSPAEMSSVFEGSVDGTSHGNTRDSLAARKAEKNVVKEAKERRKSEVVTVVAEGEPPSSKEDDKQSRKRKHKIIGDLDGAELTTGEPASPEAGPSTAKLAPKKEKQKKGRSDDVVEPETPTPELEVPSTQAEATPMKDNKKGSKSKKRQGDSAMAAAAGNVPGREAPEPAATTEDLQDAESKGKKAQRRKTLKATTPDSGNDISASAAVRPHVKTAESDETLKVDSTGSESAASAQKSKKDRKKSLPAGTSQSTSQEDTETLVRAAVMSVLSRGPSAISPPSPSPSASVSQPPAQAAAEPLQPPQKRKAGRSKLSQTWGPNDLAGQEGSSTSLSTPVTAQNDVPPSTPSTEVTLVQSGAKAKALKGKKQAPRPSSVPLCPVCNEMSVHSHSQCPVVLAGPISIRKRMKQLKSVGGKNELFDELDVLLKESLRRRRSEGQQPTTRLAAPAVVPPSAPSAVPPPPSPEIPLQSASARRPPLANRSLPSPRLPAGSEISEVAVESKDEGSSNESSSDEEDSPPPLPVSTAVQDQSSLEAILYGPPKKPRVSIVEQIPSSSSSEGEESDEEEEKDVDAELEEEVKHDLAFRRMSRKLERAPSSSSSDDEREPEPAPIPGFDTSPVDVDDVVIPPVEMDPGPNSSIDNEDAQEVEADVLAQQISAVTESAVQSEDEAPKPNGIKDTEKSHNFSEEEENEMMDDPEADEDEEAEPATPEPRPVSATEDDSSDSEADNQEVPPDDRGDDHRVEPVAKVDPLVHQENVNNLAEEPVQQEDIVSHAGVDVESEPGNSTEDVSTVFDAVEKGKPEAGFGGNVSALKETEAEVDNSGIRAQEQSPELGGPEPALHSNAAPALSAQTGGAVEADDTEDPNVIEVDVVQPHTEDPSDPIDSFSSIADKEERDIVENGDSIEEDPDTAEIPPRKQTPPAAPRTPGTVYRMKDRYGRLSQARARDSMPSLSQQLLGDLVLPQEDITLQPEDITIDSVPEMETVTEGEVEANQEQDTEQTGKSDKSSEPRPQPDHVEEPEAERRRRRMTRIATTRISSLSSIVQPSSQPEPTPTPTPAPAPTQRRRGVRLTEEEKAQRMAEKAQKDAEKKAERDRKAAEKAQKDAEKKAERERKAAEKKAEKEAREAAKLAAKAEKAQPKRVTRARGATTKPISTRHQRTIASVEEETAEQEKEKEQVQVQLLTEEHHAEEASGLGTSNIVTPGVKAISWTALQQTQPRTQTESVGEAESSMIDELQPSSPEPVKLKNGRGRGMKTVVIEETVVEEPASGDVQASEGDPLANTPKPDMKQPLFIPSSSQAPITPFGIPGSLVESTPFRDGVNASDDDEEPDKTFKAPLPPRPSWHSQAMYPSLTILASQQLFPATQISSPALFSQTPKADGGYKLSQAVYGKGSKGAIDDPSSDESESDSDSDSDSDDGKKEKSHIPQNRRAGAGVQKKKKSGLFSAFD